MDSEGHPFLSEKSSSDSSSECKRCSEYRHRRFHAWFLPFLISFVILFFMIGIIFCCASQVRKDLAEPSLLAPAKISNAVQYEAIRYRSDAWVNSTYVGDPSHQSDQAWQKLLNPVRSVRFSDDEATRFNLSTLAVISGKAIIFGVNHNLHCLRYLFQFIHSDYYDYTQGTTKERVAQVEHAHHCLEALRLSVMCVPDLTPLGLFWEDKETWKVGTRADSLRECVKWDPLAEWMNSRLVTLEDFEDFVHTKHEDN